MVTFILRIEKNMFNFLSFAMEIYFLNFYHTAFLKFIQKKHLIPQN